MDGTSERELNNSVSTNESYVLFELLAGGRRMRGSKEGISLSLSSHPSAPVYKHHKCHSFFTNLPSARAHLTPDSDTVQRGDAKADDKLTRLAGLYGDDDCNFFFTDTWNYSLWKCKLTVTLIATILTQDAMRHSRVRDIRRTSIPCGCGGFMVGLCCGGQKKKD